MNNWQGTTWPPAWKPQRELESPACANLHLEEERGNEFEGRTVDERCGQTLAGHIAYKLSFRNCLAGFRLSRGSWVTREYRIQSKKRQAVSRRPDSNMCVI